MNADVAVARPLRAALQREWLLLVFAAVGVALAWIDPQPASAYRRWLHVPSLAGLTGLLIAIQARLSVMPVSGSRRVTGRVEAMPNKPAP